MTIWGLAGLGLGDAWATVNLLLRYSLKDGPLELSRYCRLPIPENDRSVLLGEILEALDIPRGASLSISNELADDWISCCGFRKPYYPTRDCWVKNNQRRIVAQFDGRSNAHNKNMEPKDIEKFVAEATDLGYEIWMWDGNAPLAYCIAQLANCSFFIGVCSGASHVAHSVGCPTFIIERPSHGVDFWHGGGPFTKLSTPSDVFSKVN